LEVVVREWDLVYKNFATCWVVETLEQLHDSRLATSTSTHERDKLTGFGADADTAQDAVVGSSRICKSDILQLNLAFQSLNLLAVGGPVIDLRNAVDE
jgi:hypothetical protein